MTTAKPLARYGALGRARERPRMRPGLYHPGALTAVWFRCADRGASRTRRGPRPHHFRRPPPSNCARMRFPVCSPRLPGSHQKIPVSISQGISHLTVRTWAIFRRQIGRSPLEFTKFPVLFPDRRESDWPETGSNGAASTTTHSFEPRDFPETSKRPAIGGSDVGVSVSVETFSGREAFSGELSLALGIPFPGNGDRRQQRRGSNVSTAQSNPASDADATIRQGGRKVGPRPFRGGGAHQWPP
jgi:hypothetical protein